MSCGKRDRDCEVDTQLSPPASWCSLGEHAKERCEKEGVRVEADTGGYYTYDLCPLPRRRPEPRRAPRAHLVDRPGRSARAVAQAGTPGDTGVREPADTGVDADTGVGAGAGTGVDAGADTGASSADALSAGAGAGPVQRADALVRSFVGGCRCRDGPGVGSTCAQADEPAHSRHRHRFWCWLDHDAVASRACRHLEEAGELFFAFHGPDKAVRAWAFKPCEDYPGQALCKCNGQQHGRSEQHQVFLPPVRPTDGDGSRFYKQAAAKGDGGKRTCPSEKLPAPSGNGRIGR